MATPVIDLRQRLRGAGLPEEQADVIAAGFEALDRRLERVESRQRIHSWMLGVILAAVLAPYVGALFGLSAS